MLVKCKLEQYAYKPTKAHKEDAGLDLRTPIDFTVKAKCSHTIDTGVHIQVPVGFVGMIKSKSGLNVKSSIQTEGVVDALYNGTIVVKLYNNSENDYNFKSGDKITQLVILPIPEVDLQIVDVLDESERGSNGFGSSGR